MSRAAPAGRAKTDAGSYREVDLPGGLIEALSEWKAISKRTGPGDPVFATRGGRRQTVTNADARLKTAIRAANVRLEQLGTSRSADGSHRIRSGAPTPASGRPPATT